MNGADEKLKTALLQLLDARMSSRWTLRAKERRELGRAAAGGQQLVFYILSFYILKYKFKRAKILVR